MNNLPRTKGTTMHSIYFDLNIPKFLLTKALSKIWKNVFYSFLSPISYSDLKETQLPGSKWVRVKNKLSGICGSDLSLFFLEANPKISLAALRTLSGRELRHLRKPIRRHSPNRYWRWLEWIFYCAWISISKNPWRNQRWTSSIDRTSCRGCPRCIEKTAAAKR